MHTTLPPASADPWRAAAALPGLAAPALLEAGPSVERGDLGTRLSATESELVTLCPPAEALQAQFEKFKATKPGEGDLGAGYYQPARFKLEWLKLDRDEFSATV